MKINRASKTCRTIVKDATLVSLEFQKEKRKWVGLKKC